MYSVMCRKITYVIMETGFIMKNCLIFVLSFTFYIGLSQAAPITATISLPNGHVAPASGLQIFIQARDINAIEPFQSTFGMIMPGESSMNYTLANVSNNNAADWRISYGCASSITDGCLDYVSTGFYKAGITGNATYKEGEASTIKQGSNVNMTILEGIKMSGTMSMPFGVAPAGGADFRMWVRKNDFSLSFNHVFTFAEGTNIHPFGITVPNDAALDYEIRYECIGSGAFDTYCFDNFVRNGFFNSSVPNNTVADSNDAEQLQGNIARNDIDMQFLTGTTISGTVFLPSGTAPASGIPIRVGAIDTQNGNLGGFRTFTVAENTNSVDFRISVTEDNLAAWRISASCDASSNPSLCASLNYFTSFYDADAFNTTTDSVSDADSLPGGQDHANINITLLSGLTISGLLIIEDGFFAPAGGLTVSVSVQDSAGGGVSLFKDIFIAEGLTSAPFSFAVPNSDTDWWLLYSCRSEVPACDEFTSFGVYDSGSPGMTSFNLNESETLPGGINHSGKILTVFSDPSEESQNDFYVIPIPNGKSIIFSL